MEGIPLITRLRDLAYVSLLLLISPAILWRCLRFGRYRRGWGARLAGRVDAAVGATHGDDRPPIWFHAVSVGEVLQLTEVVAKIQQDPDSPRSVVISASTDAGYDLAKQRFPDARVIWFPLDFSWAVRRAIERIRPQMVVLVELEIWPNFVDACARRKIPVALINARLSERSFQGYRRIDRLVRPTFQKLTHVFAQSTEYADRLIAMGVRAENLTMTGSLKFDGLSSDRNNPATRSLRELLQIPSTGLVWVVGSTQAPEERLMLEVWGRLRPEFPNLHLVLVPRHPERFEVVAGEIASHQFGLARRSKIEPGQEFTPGTVRLLDSVGELKACWGLADIAFVGGSFGNRGGQNMLEPAAYGAVVTYGPNTSNFRDITALLEAAEAAVRLHSPEEIETTMRQLLRDKSRRRELGRNAVSLVQLHGGAVAKTVTGLQRLQQGRDAQSVGTGSSERSDAQRAA